MMSEYLPAENTETSTTAYRGPFSIEVRERAFQLWAFQCRRNSGEVARLLAEQFPECADITDRTIRNWANTLGWRDESRRRIHEVAPDLVEGIFEELFESASYAARYLTKANRGDPDVLIKGRLDLGRITAAFGALDRIGFSPRVSRDASGLLDPPAVITTANVDLHSMTPDQLSAYQRNQVIEAHAQTIPEKEDQE